MAAFKHLFSPIEIGGVEIKNRIFIPPHGVSFAPGTGGGNERVIDYHIERAKGGAGIVMMSNYCTPASWSELGTWGGALSRTPVGLNEINLDTLKPHYKTLISGVRSHGARFISQLNAGGRQGGGPGTDAFQLPLWAPSDLPCPTTRVIPKAMEVEDIQDFIRAFVQGALNAEECGADGVELFAAQGYLLSEFLSPHTNKRSDQYGGSLENRARFLIEALTAIRKAVGRKFLLGVRMNGDDFTPGGLQIAEAQQIAQLIRASGTTQYLSITGKTYWSWPGWIADVNQPAAQFAHLSAAIKKAVPELKIGVVSRIGTPQLGEQIIANGQADLVGMARATIADPELPNKAMRGEVDRIRLCTYGNQSCIMKLIGGQGLACVHNPAIGREKELGAGSLKSAAKKKKVVVVGGGPAGVAAARIAASRGHDVTLFEKDLELGGQNRMTVRVASRASYKEITRWQRVELDRSGAKVRMGTTATVEMVLGEKPDVVVVASGSTPRRTGYSSLRPTIERLPGVDQANVYTVWDAFDETKKIGKNVVLIDEDPHMSGVSTAEYLADRGHKVTIVTPQVHPGDYMEISFVPDLYRRILPKGIEIVANTFVSRIEGERLVLEDRYTGQTRLLTGVDGVVLAMGNQVNDGLYRSLKGKVTVHAIGDALAPRRLDEAILDGERIGRMI